MWPWQSAPSCVLRLKATLLQPRCCMGRDALEPSTLQGGFLGSPAAAACLGAWEGGVLPPQLLYLLPCVTRSRWHGRRLTHAAREGSECGGRALPDGQVRAEEEEEEEDAGGACWGTLH